MNIVILASGSGTNAMNLYRSFLHNEKINVRKIITNNPKAGIINRFSNEDINIEIISSVNENKEIFENKLHLEISKVDRPWLILAGFMKILSADFLNLFYDKKLEQNRVINIHPSFLPHHPGLNAIEKSFQDENVYGGVTVHFVDQGVDTGEIILQSKILKSEVDTLEKYTDKVHSEEYKLFPKAIEIIYEKYYENH